MCLGGHGFGVCPAYLKYGRMSEMSTDQDKDQFWPEQDWMRLQFF